MTVALTVVALAAPANAEELSAADVKVAMLRVEQTLAVLGVDVAGYASQEAPMSELAPADHPYLQGNDGAYADGRIYLNKDAIKDCRELMLIHELVHDATVKRRLFATVPNTRVRDLLEALADAVVEQAAGEPYRPGCVTHRSFGVSTAELARLAQAAPEKSAALSETRAAAIGMPLPGAAPLRPAMRQ
jgi:hypothetical protein